MWKAARRLSHLSTEGSAFRTCARFLHLLHGTSCAGCALSRDGAWESTPRVSVYVGGTFKHDLEIHSFCVSETSTDTLQLQAAFQKPLPACLPALGSACWGERESVCVFACVCVRVR